MQFAQKLQKLMDSKKISCYGLAKNLGVSRSSLSNWIYGKTKPHPNYIKQIADYFSVTEECLLDDSIEDVIYVIKATPSISNNIQSSNNPDTFRRSNLLPVLSPDAEKLLKIFEELNEDDRTILMGEALKLQKAAKN